MGMVHGQTWKVGTFGFYKTNYTPCLRLSDDKTTLTISNIEDFYVSVTDNVDLRLSWGDGAYTTLPRASLTRTGPDAQGYYSYSYSGSVSHDYGAPPNDECLYLFTIVPVINGNVQLARETKNITIWSTDNRMNGELILLTAPPPTGPVDRTDRYLVCQGQAFSIYFIDETNLNCNLSLTSDPDSKQYTNNNDTRHTQFVYGDVTQSAPQIPQMSVGGTPLTTIPSARDTKTSGIYVHPGPFAVGDHLNQPTEVMSVAKNVTTAGQEFTITLRNWNTCNPYTQFNVPYVNDIVTPPTGIAPRTKTAKIIVVPAPPEITSRTLTFCNSSANGGSPYDYTMNLNYNPGTMTKGRFVWYAYNGTNVPGAQILEEPYRAGYSLDPYDNKKGNNTKKDLPAANKLKPGVAGEYKYWVQYVFDGDYDASSTYFCETDPVLMTWVVREDINPAIDLNKISGLKAVCSGNNVTLTIDPGTYPNSYPLGGNVDYVWGNPTVSGSTGVTVSNVTRSGSQNRTISFTVDPDLKQISGSNGTVSVTISRQWHDPTSSGSLCPNIPTTIKITIYPLPTATLKLKTPADADICPGSSPTLQVSTVAGASGSTKYTLKLNDGSGFSGQTISSKTTNTDITPNTVTGPAVTEYFVYTIKDDATGCVSTNQYNGNPAQLIPNNAPGIQVTWRANLATGTYDPPNTITPPNNSLFCTGSSQTFNVGTAPAAINHPGKNVSTGGAPATNPAAKNINTEYAWSWAPTTNNSPSYTGGSTSSYTVSNVGTSTQANGTPYKLRVYTRYTDLKCNQSNTRTWDYTIIPSPTATIPPQTIEYCENATGNVTVNFNVTGYRTGAWTVGWELSGNGMTPVTGTANAAANTSGSSSGQILINLSAFAGIPNKYGTYTVKLTSVTQATGATPGNCSTTPTATQSIRLLRMPTATLSGSNTICEGADYTLPNNSVTLTGEAGTNYSITYRTRNNGGTVTCNNVLVDPITNGRFTVSKTCIDNAATGNITTVELLTVAQGACSNTATGSYVITIDKYPEQADVPLDEDAICGDLIPISAVNTAGTWSISNKAGSTPAGTTVGTDYGFDGSYQPTSTTPNTTFGIRNSKYGRYILVWTVGSAGSVCPASTDTIIVNLSDHADPATIKTPAQIVCGYTITLETNDVLKSWETGIWSQVSGPGTITSNIPVSGTNNRTVTVSLSGTYVFEWRRAVPAPCNSDAKTVSITFGDIPIVDWTGLNPSYCPGDNINVSFSETSGIPAGQIGYRWIPANTIGTYTAGNTQTANPLTATAPANNTNVYATYAIQQVQAINTITVTDPAYVVKVVGCPSAAKNFDIVVKPTPAIGNVYNINVCPGEQITYNLDPSLTSATSANTIWTWTNTSITPTVGLITPTFQGTSAIATPGQPTTNSGGGLIAEPNIINLQVSVEGCPSAPATLTITVNPTPVPTIISGPQPLCPNTADVLTFNNVVANTNIQYTWTYTGNNTDLTSSGSTPTQTYSRNYTSRDNQTDANTTSTFTAKAYGLVTSDISGQVCQESSAPFTIIVKPRPNMRALSDQKQCGAGGTFSTVDFDITNRGSRTVTYAWVNTGDVSIAGVDQTETVLSQTVTSYNGSGTTAGIRNITIPDNITTADKVGVITVTSTMDGCSGDPRTVNLTAMRRPVLTPMANDSVCANGSFQIVNPYAANTGVSQIDFTITNSTPASVKVAGNAGATNSYTVYSNSESVQFTALTNNTGGYLDTHISVQATGSDLPDGGIVGCTGPAESFILTVKPTPIISAPVNNTTTPIEELCPGATFNPVTFNSNITNKPAKVVYSWAVQDYNIGSGMNGSATGNGSSMPGFTAIGNATGNKITSTIQVTATLDGCSSSPVRFTQRLKPTPQMRDLGDISVCPGNTVPVVGITHNVVGKNTDGVKWQVNSTNVELLPQAVLAPGLNTWVNGNTPSFVANVNPATMPSPPDIVAIFTVSATVDGCDGNTDTYEVHVNPTPDIQGTNNISLCNNEVQPQINFNSLYFPGQATYEWERTDVVIGTPNPLLQGTGSIAQFQAKNTSTGMLTDVVSTVSVRSKSTAGCPSDPVVFDITVRAVPQLKYSDIVVCADSTVTPAVFDLQNPNSAGAIYNWLFLSNYTADYGLPGSSGTGDLPQFSPNTSTSTFWADDARPSSQIRVNIELNGCNNDEIINSQRFNLQVNPLPTTVWVNQPTSCVMDGGKQLYQADTGSGTMGSEYHWGTKTLNSSPGAPTRDDPTSTLNYAVFSYPTPVELWEGIIFVRERNRYGCWGDTAKTQVAIQPTPKAYAGRDRMICYGDTVKLHGTVTRVASGATNIIYNWQPRGVLIAGETTLDPTAQPTATTEIYFDVEIDGCKSNRDTVVVAVNPKPGAPFFFDKNYCSKEPLWNMSIDPNSIGKKSNNTPNDVRWWRDDSGTPIVIGNSNNQLTINMKDDAGHPGSIPNPIVYTGLNEQSIISYYVRQINEFGCISDSSKAYMTIRKTPGPLSTTPIAYCQIPGQSSYQMDQVGNNVRWYFPDSATYTGYTTNTYWARQSQPGVYPYYVTQVGVNGCESYAAEKDLTVYALPKLNMMVVDSVTNAITTGGCADFTVIATNRSNEANVNYQWFWGDNTDQIATPNIPTSHIYKNTTSAPEQRTLLLQGISTTKVDDVSHLGCQKDTSIVLTIHPRVKADFFVTDTAGCADLSVFFTSTSSNASGFRWYWNRATAPPNGSTADMIGPNPPHTFTNPSQTQIATYHVWLQVDNSICYSNKDTVITVYPKPGVNFSHNLPSNTICPPDSVLFTNLSVGNASTPPPIVQYMWDYGDGAVDTTDVNTTNIYHKYINISAMPINRKVEMTAMNVFPSRTCSNSMTKYITINPQVTAEFISDVAGCSPIMVQFIDQSVGARSYSWDFGDGTPGSGIMPQHQFVNPTHNQVKVYRVKLTASNNWCKDTVSHPFTLYPQPAVGFTVDKVSGCQPLEVTFSNTSIGNPTTGMTYIYDFGDASADSVKNDISKKFIHPYTNLGGTNAVVWPKLTARNEWWCTNSYTTDITIFPYVKADFRMSDTAGCAPLNISFVNGSRGYSSYLWDFGDGDLSSTVINPNHKFNNSSMYQTKIYQVKLTVTSGANCSDTQMQQVYVYGNPTADFRPGAPYPADFLYPAPPILMENLIRLPDRDSLKYLWSWAEQGVNYSNPFSAIEYPDPLRITSWGRFDITQKVTSPDGHCFDSKTLTINIVPPAPIAQFDAVPPACMPYEVKFNNKSKYAKAYLWSFGDGTTSSVENPVHTYTDAGIYTVTLTATGDFTFPGTYSHQIVVHPMPQASFEISPNFLWVGQPLRAFNYSVHQTAAGQDYDVWYRWDWGDNTPVDTAENPSHMYLKAGTYDISLTVGTYTDPQCIATYVKSDAVDLENAGDIILPNSFKPRSAGEPSDVIPERGYKNYLFYPPVLSPTRKYSFMIFNRWGQLLFETTNPEEGWNGYFKGRMCDEGVYIYKIEGVFETGQSFSKMGDVLLLR